MSAPHPKAQDDISPLHWFGRKPVPDTPKEAADRLLRLIRDMPEAESEAVRPCTCHPDDDPPIPCAQKYALSECKAAAGAQINRLDDIATLIRTARYSEFIALAEGIGVDPKALWRWASR